MSGLSVRLWNDDVSCCLVFDSVTSSLVDTLLTVLTNHGGVGEAGKELLRNSENIVMGAEEETLAKIEVAAKTPRAVIEWMGKIEVKTEEPEKLNVSEELKVTEMELNNCIELVEQMNDRTKKVAASETNEQTFTCPYCDHTSNRKYNLEKVHIPKKHWFRMRKVPEKQNNKGDEYNDGQHEGSGEKGEEDIEEGKKNDCADQTVNSMSSNIKKTMSTTGSLPKWKEIEPTKLFESVLGEHYMCEACELVVKNKYNLRDHIRIVHTPRQSPLKCSKDFCQETFVTKYQWEQHRMGCVFKCPNCGKVIRKCGRVVGHLKRCTGLG